LKEALSFASVFFFSIQHTNNLILDIFYANLLLLIGNQGKKERKPLLFDNPQLIQLVGSYLNIMKLTLA